MFHSNTQGFGNSTACVAKKEPLDAANCLILSPLYTIYTAHIRVMDPWGRHTYTINTQRSYPRQKEALT